MGTAISEPARAGVNAQALDNLRQGFVMDIARGRHFGGTLLLARKGEVVFHEGIGHLDPEKTRTASTQSLYCNMSVTKAYTAATILRLIDQGKISLTTKVATVIPEYGVRGKAGTEIWHLLNHTAGSWSEFLPPAPLTMRDVPLLDKMVPAISALQVAFRPGTQVSYSPLAAFAILGEIAQRVTDRDFSELVQDEMFGPLGMEHARFGLDPEHPDHVPMRMSDRNPGAASVDVMEGLNELLRSGVCMHAGGAFTTAHDVFRFAEMQRRMGSLDGVRFLSPAIVSYASQISTGDMTNKFWDFSKIDRGIGEFPANFTLFGGYGRGRGYHLTPLGLTASPRAFGAVGSGSTMYLVDPDREIVFVILSAGLTEGLGHFEDMQRLADLALACCDA